MSPMETRNDDQLATKLCHIIKRADFDGYGFNLHSEKAKPGQFIGKVDVDSPAEAAGLKEGDRIIEVNGVSIKNETHKQVVQRIKTITNEVRLLLIDVDGKGDGHDETIQTNGDSLAQVMPGVSENINTITIVSTKRNTAVIQKTQPPLPLPPTVPTIPTIPTNYDDNNTTTANKQMPFINNNNNNHNNNNNNNKNMLIPITTAPVTTGSVSTITTTTTDSHSTTTSLSTATAPSPTTTITTAAAEETKQLTNGTAGNVANIMNTVEKMGNKSGNGTIKTGSLQLPMTAAEMRAKLLAKKKYDPKNESVDLKKKYEIVQTL